MPKVEKWIGPFQIRDLLENCLEMVPPKPPESGSAYVVTKHSWKINPNPESVPLYVGGNTGRSARFRTRIGDLVADAIGFYTNETGHHSGGQHLHAWCTENRVKPLDLYIAWVEGTQCHRCLEDRLYRELKPILNRVIPTRCKLHFQAEAQNGQHD